MEKQIVLIKKFHTGICHFVITFKLLALLSALIVVAMVAGCGPGNTGASVAVSPAVTSPALSEVIMASTTSTRDSGLMDILLPLFNQKTGYAVKPIYVGSGQAMIMGERGEADVLLVHAPASEAKFMQSGHGVDRRLVMHNDFILVGPPGDPAGIKGFTSITDALRKIADARLKFYSRGDNSGTDQLEKSLWAKIGVDVKDGSSSNPEWYLEANLGMGDLLRVVSEKQGYTITDRATYLSNLKTLNLQIMVEGDRHLQNVYHVIVINPAKSARINYEGAKAFADFMVSPETQAVIASFGMDKYGQSLFFADAGKADSELGLPAD